MHQDSCPLASSGIVAGLLTGFGLDLLAGKLSGPKVDRATLNLVGLLFSSILLPGLARAVVAQQHKIKKGACWSKFKKEVRNAFVNIARFQQQLKRKQQSECCHHSAMQGTSGPWSLSSEQPFSLPEKGWQTRCIVTSCLEVMLAAGDGV
eukprot:4051360-Amphidinium_carterae.1